MTVVPLHDGLTPSALARVLDSRLSTEAGDVRIAVGSAFDDLKRILYSHLTAMETLATCDRLGHPGPVHCFDDVAVQVSLAALGGDWRGDRLLEAWRRLAAADRSGDLRRTFAAHVLHFDDRAACASALHVHRNTLRYRMNRIAEITGLDLDSLPDLFALYVGFLADPGSSADPDSDPDSGPRNLR